jgi:hypothetical protein
MSWAAFTLLWQFGDQSLKDRNPSQHLLVLCRPSLEAALIGSFTQRQWWWLDDP